MEKMIVDPLNSFNGIAFNTAREQVRAELNSEFTEFKKTKFSKNTTDDYKLCHVFYDTNNRLQAIETFGDIPVMLGNIDVFSITEKNLHLIANDFIEEYGSYISKSMSIGITFEKGIVESALFGVADYYK